MGNETDYGESKKRLLDGCRKSHDLLITGDVRMIGDKKTNAIHEIQ